MKLSYEGNRQSSTLFLEFVIVSGTFMLPSLVMAGGADPQAVMRLEYQLLSAVLGLPQLAFLVLFLQRSGRDRAEAAGCVAPRRDMILPAVRIAVLLFVSMGAAGLLAVWLLGARSGGPEAAAPGAVAGQPGLDAGLRVLVFAASAVVNAYREELLYRGYAVSTLQAAGAGRTTAATMAIALFTVVHLYQGAHGLIGAAVGGLVLTVAFLSRREIHSLAWAHAAYNFVLLILSSGGAAQ